MNQDRIDYLEQQKAIMNERKAVQFHDRLRDALELPLLFHSGGNWSEEKAARWREITGSSVATSKVMCDHIRALLAEIEANNEGKPR